MLFFWLNYIWKGFSLSMERRGASLFIKGALWHLVKFKAIFKKLALNGVFWNPLCFQNLFYWWSGKHLEFGIHTRLQLGNFRETTSARNPHAGFVEVEVGNGLLSTAPAFNPTCGERRATGTSTRKHSRTFQKYSGISRIADKLLKILRDFAWSRLQHFFTENLW